MKLYLPRLVASAPAVESASVHTLGQNLGETILVVEDDPDVRGYIVEVLQELKYEVLEAKDAAAALELSERKNRQKPTTQADLASRIRTVLDGPRLGQKAN